MELRKYRWSKTYEAAEEELVQLLASQSVTAERWTSDAGDVLAPRLYRLDTRLWCAEGSIALLVNGTRVMLQAGDALELPAYAVHEAQVGIGGCVCYQSPAIKLNPPLATD